MMNVLALSLVFTTLVTAGIFSENNNKKEDIVLVVEFDKDDGTKVLISPQEAEIPKGKSKSGYVSDLKDKLYEKAEEASSLLPNIGQGISPPYVSSQDQENKPSSTDVVCDVFGKCRANIVSAFGKTKEKAHEAADQVEKGVKGTAEEVKDVVMEASDKAKEKVEQVKEKAKDVVDTTKRKKAQVEREISQKAEQVKDSVKEGKKELKDILEGGRELFYDVFVYIFSLQHLRPVMRLIHLMGFAVAYGMCIWVTFVSSYVLARALSRQQFAAVQSKIYPVYFKAMAYSVGSAFLGHFLSQKKHRPYANSAEAVQGFNLLASITMLLINSLYLEPRATKVMFERLKLEKEEGRGRHIFNVEPSGTTREVESVLDLPKGSTSGKPAEISSPEQQSSAEEVLLKSQVVKLSQKLNKLNSYSSFLNVLTLMALSHHLVHLTQLLDATT